jgi:hypothetical protein
MDDNLFEGLDAWLKETPIEEAVEARCCIDCGEVKGIGDFYCRTSGRPFGACKQCTNIRSIKRTKANKETVLRQQRERRAKNPEKERERFQFWADKNREYLKEAARRYRIEHPDKAKAAARKWAQQNKDKVTAKTVRREANKLRATPIWADHDAIAALYEEAQRRTDLYGIRFQVDHIVPLRSKLVCGLHWEKNLRIITEEENRLKSNFFWPDMP